jgi:glycosyltransferase involved in cell wall biosynthesis
LAILPQSALAWRQRIYAGQFTGGRGFAVGTKLKHQVLFYELYQFNIQSLELKLGMHIFIAHPSRIPVEAYGGTERIIWWLGKELSRRGYRVTYLVKKGSSCPFADIQIWNEKLQLEDQIPDDVDLVHIHSGTKGIEKKPCVVTIHENYAQGQEFHPNAVFLSANHAYRHGSSTFIYNGIDLGDYGLPEVDNLRRYFHYLGHQTIKVKNLKGAIDIAVKARERLHVIGGSRINLQSGLRITLSPLVRFHGLIGGEGKNTIMQSSKGLIYPVLYHEPFGLGVMESLYFGCPIFGSPIGSLPELLGSKHHPDHIAQGTMDAFYSEFGVLSTKADELSTALKTANDFDRKRCQEYVADQFTVKQMTDAYVRVYEQVMNKAAIQIPVQVGV